ncbi:putative ribonuclease H-like domain-containing protein [Tanacetum coccineum]
MRPFGCPVTILNTIDHLGKFDGKANEGFFVGYSLSSKAFRVFNSRTRIVEENLHIRFSENTPNVVGSGPDWLSDIDALTRIINYEPIVAGTQSNGFARTKASDNACQARKEIEPSSHDDGSKPSSDDGKKVDEDSRKDSKGIDQEKRDNVNNTNNVNVASTNKVNDVGGKTSIELPFGPNMPALEDYSIFDVLRDDEDVGAEADINNLDTTIQGSPILTTRIHKDHPFDQVIGDLQSATQTRRMSKNLEIMGRTRKGNSCIEGSKLDRGHVGRASTIQVARKRIDYDEVFSPIARIEANRLFLAYASFKDFVVYQMDVKSAFLYGKIEEEVYVCQPPGFEDPDFPDRVYKVVKALYGLHQALELGMKPCQHICWTMSFKEGKLTRPYSLKDTKVIFCWSKCMWMISSLVQQRKSYAMNLRRRMAYLLVKTASTLIETQKPLLKDKDGEEVNVHMYRYQVNLKVSHLHAVKRIFRYLKGQPKLGLWYPKDSPFNLVAYTDRDYAGESLDRKSTT